MASDEEDEELHALRLAVLQSMKNKLAAEEEPKPCKEVVVSVRDAALPTIQQHAIVTQVQQVMSSSPWNNPHSNSPKYAQSNFHGNFHQGGFRGRPAHNSNLIVINPAPMEQPVKEAPRMSTITTTTNKPMLIRPQDKWCASDTRPVTVEQPKKEKASSKFSRFDTSDSESSDYSSSSSDSEEEEKEKVLSPVHKSDIGSDSDNFDLESDIETQIDNILNDSVKKADKEEVVKDERKLSPELPKQSATINLPHKETAEAPKKQVVEPLKKQTIEVPKKKTVTKIEAKPIPTLTNMCRNKPVKKESNCWSDSDSDTVTNSLPKSKNKRSWSDEGSSDENQVLKNSKEGKTALSSLSKLSEVTKTNKSEIEKLELKRTLENDLQKTLNALQTIKEKRQKQEAARKSSLSDVTSSEKSNKDSPHLKQKSPRSISPSSSRSPSRLSQHKQPYSPYKSSGRRSPSPRRKRSLSPRRRRSLSRSHSRSPLPRRRRSPSPRHSKSPLPRRRRSPSLSHSRSPLPRRRRSPSPRHSRSPLLTRHRRSPSSRHSKSPDTRRKQSPALRGSTSRSPSRRREKRILTSEERRKIEARRAKFENREIVPSKKTVSLKGITQRSKSKEKTQTENSESLNKSGKPKVNRTQAKRKSRESKENENSDSESSVSSVSDNDSSDDEGRSWRKEQNQNKHAEIRKRVVTARENVHLERKPRVDRKLREERNITKPKHEKGENGTSKNKSSHLTNRNYSHIYSDNIDRGFDATNYRKTDVTQKSASDDSDSDEKSKNKKLVSVVLLNKNMEEPSPTRKIERSERASKSPRQDRDRSKILKVKRKVITDDNLPFTKKPKNEDIRDASELLQGVRNRKNLSRKAVFREDGHNSLSITVQDKNSNNESPPKPSVHERLGRKVPSLMSLSIKSDDFVKVSKRDPSPEYYDSKVVQIFTKDNDSSYETRKSKTRSDDKKRKRLKRSFIDEDQTTELQDGPDDALEKRIQMIKEKNAAILKRQAEIQKDKEKFG